MKIRANRDLWLHPITLFASVWLLSLGLYAMHLSKLLVVDVSLVKRIVIWIVIPFVVTVIYASLIYWMSPRRKVRTALVDEEGDAYFQRVERALDRWFLCWVALTVVEIIFSRGLPIIWLLTHNAHNYTDYGLPFVHVFIGSLLSVIAMGKLALFLLRGERRRLRLPIFQIIWGVVVVSRGLMMTALLQYLVLFLCIKGINRKILFRTVVSAVLVIVMFGVLGNLRSGGASAFRELAQPTSNYPKWLPSGVLWFYIYLTSPLDNLGNTVTAQKPAYDITFPRTTYFLYPTPIRNAIFGKDSNLGRDSNLVNSSLNVSSAYIGPYVDYGYIGIAAYSVLLGLLSALVWKMRGNVRGLLLYAIMAECLVFSVFYNFLFYNPFLGQVFWIFLIFSPKALVFFSKTKPSLQSESSAIG